MKYGFPMVAGAIVERILLRGLVVWDIVRTYVVFIMWGVCHGRKCCLQGPALIRTHNRGDVILGNGVIFRSRRNQNTVGLLGPTTIDTRAGGCVRIGDKSGFSSVVISSKSSITIGARVMIGGNVRIYDHDFHAIDYSIRGTSQEFMSIRTRPVVIEDDVFVGVNAILLKGTHIGARSIVAAGSVVFGLDVPPDSVVKGNPAEVVKRK